MIPWLSPAAAFPPIDQALASPNGLLAATADVTAERVLAAYRQGIFPWYAEGEPVLWWSPDPRMALFADELRISRSLQKRLRALARDADVELRVDRDFIGTMRACAAPRPGQDGTWITEAIIAAYGDLHRRDLAHSIELWSGSTCLGGLYGVALGRMFFGESMFTRATDASKVCLVALARLMQKEGVPVIDCQQQTSHLASLGAREIPRGEFCDWVARAVTLPPVDWTRYASRPLNDLLLTD